jgi:glutamine amidotransferase-like uncharacterized protein
MRILRGIAGAVLFVSAVMHAGCSDDDAAGPGAPTPKIAIYSGNGCWAESITAGQRMFEWMGYRCEIVSAQRINSEGLDGFSAIYIPGGDMYQYAQSISSEGKASIRSFVSKGGGYIGICGGAYFASKYIVWRGTQFVIESLRLFEGTAAGPVDQIVVYPNFGMCEVTIVDHAHPITRAEPASDSILYYWGPTLTPDTGVQVSILGRYAITNQPAIVAFEYEKGRVFLIGTHPEIEEDSDRDSVTFGDELDDNGSEWNLMREATRWCLKK